MSASVRKPVSKISRYHEGARIEPHDCSWTEKKIERGEFIWASSTREARLQITCTQVCRGAAVTCPGTSHRVFGNIERLQRYDPVVKLCRSDFARSFSATLELGPSERVRGNMVNDERCTRYSRADRCLALAQLTRKDRTAGE